MLTFPNIDPVIVHIGPIAVHWYGVAYVVGLLVGWQYAAWIARRFVPTITKEQIDGFMMWALGGVIIGGRLGHVLFFELDRYIANPAEILMTWKGGMSFHGGLLGVIIAVFLYCRKTGIPFFRFSDIMCAIAPLGIFLGRLANFINAELPGRVTDVSWGMVFPYAGPLPRHPSQIYEAALEGLALLIILHIGWRSASFRDVPGRLTGIFFIWYSLARYLVEFVREPDTFHKFLSLELTTGQLLCIPMMIAGIFFLAQPARNFEKVKCL